MEGLTIHAADHGVSNAGGFDAEGLACWRGQMAARRKKAARRSGKPAELIISKSRTKAAVKKCNVGQEFYGALDGAVRELIKGAEARAVGNKRKTLKGVDL